MADLPLGQVGNVAQTEILRNIDHSDLASSSQPSPGGTKKYFVMVGQLTTLAWKNWTVVNVPDPTGALYPGPGILILATINVGSPPLVG